MSMPKLKVLAALAPVFNALMGIGPTHFCHETRASGPSAANLRAADRLRQHRAQWADTPDTSKFTRQRRRQAERLAAKGRKQ